MRLIFSSLLLTILLIQLPQSFTQQTCPAGQLLNTLTNACVTTCPTATYIGTQDTQAACLPQTAIEARIRPANEQRMFMVLFDNGPGPFNTVEQFQQQVKVSLSVFDTAQNIPLTATFLSENRDIVQVFVDAPEIPRETPMFFIFPNLQNVNTSQGYIISSKVITPLPYSQLSEDDQDEINALRKVDRGLEYAWIAVTCLNPYAYLYMNTKLYRETLEMFKRVNVQYSPYATRFFLLNNNKVSGFKAPNMFPIIIEDDPVRSGWNRGEDDRLLRYGIDADRIQDLKVPTADTVANYDPFPLFLDNYGIQITVFLLIIVLIVLFEIINIMFCCQRRRATSRISRAFYTLRTYLKWNLLIASIIGSFQSLTFYFMVQMHSWSKQDEHNSHDKLNFWFAIGTIIVLAVFFPIVLITKLLIISKEVKDEKKMCNYHERYGIFVKIFNPERRKALGFMFVMMLRAAAFAALTFFLRKNAIAQISVMVAFALFFLVYLIVLRPFMRIFHFIYQVLNEIALIFYLATLLYLAHQDENDHLDSSEGDASGKTLIALWLLIPALGIFFGFINIIMSLVHRPKKSQKYFEPIVVVDGMPHDQKVVESGQKIMDAKDFEQERSMSLTKNPDFPTEVQTIELGAVHPEVERESGVVENPKFLEEEARTTPFQFGSNSHVRRSPPSLPTTLSDRIGTIVEEVEGEKEQLSAKIIKEDDSEKEQLSAKVVVVAIPEIEKEQPFSNCMNKEKPKKVEPVNNFYQNNNHTRLSDNISPIKYNNSYRPTTISKEIDLEERETLRAPKHGSDSDAQSQGSQSHTTRTQDRVKAKPMSLDIAMPSSITRQAPSARSTVRSNFDGFNTARSTVRNNNEDYNGRFSVRNDREDYNTGRLSVRNDNEGYNAGRLSVRNDREDYNTGRLSARNDNQGYNGGRLSVRNDNEGYSARRLSVRGDNEDYNVPRSSHRVQKSAFPSIDDFMKTGRANRNYNSLERTSVNSGRYVGEEGPRRSVKRPIFE